MSFKVIEKELGGKGKIKAFLLEEDNESLSTIFENYLYPEISHLDVYNEDIFDKCKEVIDDVGNNRLLFIDSIFIDEVYRGNGVAKESLMALLEEYSIDFSMLIACPIDNSDGLDVDGLIGFYKGIGYEEVVELDLGMGSLMSII